MVETGNNERDGVFMQGDTLSPHAIPRPRPGGGANTRLHGRSKKAELLFYVRFSILEGFDQ
jgi:hypothetical protein